MLKEVFLVKAENRAKAEDALRADDLISRQSITLKLASSLDMKEDGYFIIINGSELSVARAEELLKGVAEKYKDKEKVIKKAEEQENQAIEGFGNILG